MAESLVGIIAWLLRVEAGWDPCCRVSAIGYNPGATGITFDRGDLDPSK